MARQSTKSIRKSSGLTLYELILSLAVSAVTLAIATPSVSGVIAQNKLTANINSLVGSVLLARAEAVARRENVVICRSVTAGTAFPSCDTGAGSWSDGWIVFANTDNDAPPVRDAGEPVLQVKLALKDGYALDSSAVFDDAVVFDEVGDVGSVGEFVLCKDGDTYYSRSISLDRTGNVNSSTRSPGGVLTRRDGTVVGSCSAL